jgi:hypothetical protein
VLASLSCWGRKIRWKAAKEQSAWQVVRRVEDGFTRLWMLVWALTMMFFTSLGFSRSPEEVQNS